MAKLPPPPNTRPWLRIQASGWWARVLLAGGARRRPLSGANRHAAPATGPEGDNRD
jgi:hypothetical protein